MITEERKDRLYAELAKLEIGHQVENLMGRVVAALNFRQTEKLLGFFAMQNEEVSLEVADEGLFQGPEAVSAFVRETVGQPVKPGEMLDLQLTTPIVEVADDLQSARALWWCPGAGALPREGELPQAIWVWGMIAADLTLEDEGWRVLHLHYFRLIKCDYHKGWVEDTSMINRLNIPVHPLAKPTTWHDPYSPLNIRQGIPAAPRPYRTYDGSDWMLEKDKTK